MRVIGCGSVLYCARSPIYGFCSCGILKLVVHLHYYQRTDWTSKWEKEVEQTADFSSFDLILGDGRLNGYVEIVHKKIFV